MNRPSFEKDYLEKKASEQKKVVNEAKVNKANTRPENNKQVNKQNAAKGLAETSGIAGNKGNEPRESKEKKKMPTYLKVLICVIGIGGVVAAGSYLAYRSASIESATATVPIETTTAETETPIDNEVLRVEYENEARLKWDENIENLEGDKEAFVSEWVDLRISGLDVDSTYGRLYEKYQKRYVDMDAEQQAALIEAQLVAESAEPTETTETVTQPSDAPKYTVIAIDPVVRYAKTDVNVRDLPDQSGNKVDTLVQNTEVTVTGYVDSYNDKDCLWYEVEIDAATGTRAFINGGLLVDAKIETPPASQSNTGTPETPASNANPTDDTATTQPPANTGNTTGGSNSEWTEDPEEIADFFGGVTGNPVDPDVSDLTIGGTWH